MMATSTIFSSLRGIAKLDRVSLAVLPLSSLVCVHVRFYVRTCVRFIGNEIQARLAKR